MSKGFAALLFLLNTDAWATGPLHGIPIHRDTSVERYADDLVGQDPAKRLFAVRVLRTRAREACRIASKRGEEIRNIEARQTLADFDTLVAPRCIRQLKVDSIRQPCAEILGMLETTAALPALKAAQVNAHNKREQRIIASAIKRIESTE